MNWNTKHNLSCKLFGKFRITKNSNKKIGRRTKFPAKENFKRKKKKASLKEHTRDTHLETKQYALAPRGRRGRQWRQRNEDSDQRITSELENTCSRTKDRGDHSTTEPLSGKERWLDNCDRPTDFVRDYSTATINNATSIQRDRF